MKPGKLIYQKIPEDKFLRVWVEFLGPFHKLTSRERDVMARIIAQYYKLRESIPDQEVLKEVMWSNTSRKDMRESLGMTPAHFQMILTTLKKNGILDDGLINKRFLPDGYSSEDSRYMFSVVLDWSSQKHPING